MATAFPRGIPRPQDNSEDLVERIAWLMDRSVPLGGRYSIGLDGLIGLIPGVGDIIGGLIGAIVIVQAHRAGLPRATVLRMVANVAIDAAVGSVPILGDLFDFVFKATSRNVALYRRSMAGAGAPGRDLGFVTVVVLCILAAVASPLVAVAWLLSQFWGA